MSSVLRPWAILSSVSFPLCAEAPVTCSWAAKVLKGPGPCLHWLVSPKCPLTWPVQGASSPCRMSLNTSDPAHPHICFLHLDSFMQSTHCDLCTWALAGAACQSFTSIRSCIVLQLWVGTNYPLLAVVNPAVAHAEGLVVTGALGSVPGEGGDWITGQVE